MLPLVITVSSRGEDRGRARRYAFAESPVTVGRSGFAELQLSEAFVSRWEGTIRFDAAEITYFALGSTNATYIDGRAVTPRDHDIVIHEGSVLSIGELDLKFSREPVADADVRRKGKPRSVVDDRHVDEQTVYLDVLSQRERIGTPSETSRPLPTPAPFWRDHPDPKSGMYAVEPDKTLSTLYRSYCDASAALLHELRERIESSAGADRKALITRLLRHCPDCARQPGFRELLRDLDVPVNAADLPELRQWLQRVTGEVLPERLQFDDGLTLERVLRLIEILAQSLAEVHSAQDSVRSRWLGRTPSRSVLRSENGQAILAYLLNPQAHWNERVAELKQTVRDAVMHELALFKATLEAGQRLVETLSPSALEQAEQITASAEPKRGDWWRRLRGLDSPEVRLWRRLVSVHGDLLDGQRYQRFLWGRTFSQSYDVVLGQLPAATDARSAQS